MSGLAAVFFTLGISSTADAIGWVPIGIGIGSGTLSGLYYTGLNNYPDTYYLNESFPENVENPSSQYKPILDDTLEYDIYLDSSGIHWYVVVHANAPIGKFPYVTFEITRNISLWSAIKGENSPLVTLTGIICPEKEKGLYQSSGFVCPTLKGAGLVASMAGGGSIGHTMLNISGCYLTKKGTLNTTMRNISEIAERIRQEMGTYNLYSSNCRHFANKFLSELGLPTTPDTMDKAFKKFQETYDEIKKKFGIIRRKYDEYQKAFDEFKKAFDEIFDENEIVYIFLLLIELENEIKSFTYK